MNKCYLEELIAEGLSTHSIAKKINKSQTTVIYWLKKYNLKTNPLLYQEKINGEYRYCISCKKDCLVIDFYPKRGKLYSSSYCKNCTNKISIDRRKAIKSKSEPKEKVPLKHTPETKERMSKARKAYLKENPDKHNWKNNNKFKSVPCENFKNILNELNIKYISEYTILEDRNFSIDIFLTDYNIGIEINGNQHYNRDGTLKEYYKNRHESICNSISELHELHYSLFFDVEKMKKLAISITENKEIFDFNYDAYLLSKLNKKVKKCECGKEIGPTSIRCISCNSFNNRKVSDRPSIGILVEEVKTLGYCGTGLKYGVCDATIKKWINKKEP